MFDPQALTAMAGELIDQRLNGLPPDERMPLCQALADGARLAVTIVSPVDPGEDWKVRVSLVQGAVELHLSDDKPMH
jgi:hypothetical protein